MSIVVYALNVLTLEPDDACRRKWLDPERQAAVTRYRFREDRARCMGAGLLLAFAVRRYYPGYSLPPRVETTPDKKPFLPQLPDFHFNLSHSGDWAVCAVSDVPVGIDIERIDRAVRGPAQRYFSNTECAYLDSLPSLPETARESAFFEIWTLKESYMKATGLGMRLPLKEFSVRPGSPAELEHARQTEPYSLTVCAFQDRCYRMSVAARQADPISCRAQVISLAELQRALEEM